MNDDSITHDHLVQRAESWLRKIGCGVTFAELATCTGSGEIPDAIGWRNQGRITILVECKVSRADFLADRQKRFRAEPARGMGDWRFYLCPRGLLDPDEVPEGWGLLYVTGNKIRAVKGLPLGNCSWGAPPFTAAKHEETVMLVSALRRINIRGLLHHVYDRLSIDPVRAPEPTAHSVVETGASDGAAA